MSFVAQGGTLVLVNTAVTRSREEAVQAGFDPDAFAIIAGTENYDLFTTTAGPDLICGFGGTNIVDDILSADDVFLGGDGEDVVIGDLYGIFNGGAGDDTVNSVDGGTFNGSDGNELVGLLSDGIFNGGAGDDTVQYPRGGTFNQD